MAVDTFAGNTAAYLVVADTETAVAQIAVGTDWIDAADEIVCSSPDWFAGKCWIADIQLVRIRFWRCESAGRTNQSSCN